MRILAIETSCDETAVALVEGNDDRVSVRASFVRSQIDIHQVYGGVVPEVAAREHLAVIAPMLARAVRHDGEGIDAIAVTAGPGLAPALRVGAETAKALAWAWKKPLVPVCHLEGHVYASWLVREGEGRGTKGDTLRPSHSALWELRTDGTEGGRGAEGGGGSPKFPVLALIVSGGHTELVLMRDHGQFERIGETLDDAAGEAFDKVAKMLGLPYPGGPAVAALAQHGRSDAFAFPRALLNRDDFMFSFAGVKTSVLYTLRKNESRMEDDVFCADIAASFQEAVVDALVQKTMRAAGKYSPASIVLAGGVAANLALRDRLVEAGKAVAIPVHLPEFRYSLDNAAMIGVAGYFRAQQNAFVDPRSLVVDPNMDI